MIQSNKHQSTILYSQVFIRYNAFYNQLMCYMFEIEQFLKCIKDNHHMEMFLFN